VANFENKVDSDTVVIPYILQVGKIGSIRREASGRSLSTDKRCASQRTSQRTPFCLALESARLSYEALNEKINASTANQSGSEESYSSSTPNSRLSDLSETTDVER